MQKINRFYVCIRLLETIRIEEKLNIIFALYTEVKITLHAHVGILGKLLFIDHLSAFLAFDPKAVRHIFLFLR